MARRRRANWITLRAAADDHARRGGRHERMMPEGLAPVHVGNVHLDDRRLERVQCIENGHRCVGEGAGIDHQPAGLAARLVDPVDDLILAVGLEKARAPASARRRRVRQSASTCGQGFAAIDFRLAHTQHIEVGTIGENVDWSRLTSMPRRCAGPVYQLEAGERHFRRPLIIAPSVFNSNRPAPENRSPPWPDAPAVRAAGRGRRAPDARPRRARPHRP